MFINKLGFLYYIHLHVVFTIFEAEHVYYLTSAPSNVVRETLKILRYINEFSALKGGKYLKSPLSFRVVNHENDTCFCLSKEEVSNLKWHYP